MTNEVIFDVDVATTHFNECFTYDLVEGLVEVQKQHARRFAKSTVSGKESFGQVGCSRGSSAAHAGARTVPAAGNCLL